MTNKFLLDLTKPIFSNSFIGFDALFNDMYRLQNIDRGSGYPPYNIEQTDENGLRITLAVAGFSMDDLHVTIEDNQLIIRGKQEDDVSDRHYLHRGIAARQFQRAFVLAEGIEVTGAGLDNGLLHIELERIVPEPEVRTIKIDNGNSGSKRKNAQTINVEAE